ncbi:hypothetical protein K3495_g17123, partial [Podosphaera aphanis]
MSTQNVGKGQFYRTVSSGRVSPLRSSGRPHALTSEQVDELVAYICLSRETRRMTVLELSMNFPHWVLGNMPSGVRSKGEDTNGGVPDTNLRYQKQSERNDCHGLNSTSTGLSTNGFQYAGPTR